MKLRVFGSRIGSESEGKDIGGLRLRRQVVTVLESRAVSGGHHHLHGKIGRRYDHFMRIRIVSPVTKCPNVAWYCSMWISGRALAFVAYYVATTVLDRAPFRAEPCLGSGVVTTRFQSRAEPCLRSCEIQMII